VLNHSRGDKMATDTSGQQAVDFVWGNFPMQPNTDRAAAITPANIGGGAGDYSWSATTRVASDRLNPALSNHAVAEAAYAGYPGFTGNDDGAYVSGVAYIVVPSVLGDTTAVALDELKDAGYEAANITTATAATNAAISVTAAARTAGSTTATLTATGAGAAFPVGTKITVASLADTGAPLNGTYTVTANATNTVSFVSSASTVLALTGLAAGTVVGVAGTIKSQSVAAGTASVASTATITVTPYATAS
jgi:hypothetical protein